MCRVYQLALRWWLINYGPGAVNGVLGPLLAAKIGGSSEFALDFGIILLEYLLTMPLSGILYKHRSGSALGVHLFYLGLCAIGASR